MFGEEIEKMYDQLIELGVEEQTIGFAMSYLGVSKQTMETVLNWYTGLTSFEQLEKDLKQEW